jgi:hypothetical protein
MPLARKMWRSLEPYHGMIYFVPEARAAYEAIGLSGNRMGYFASRSAAMGAVPAEVVIASFYNFNPALVRGCIPEAWRRADPAEILDARLAGADRALRRLLGEEITTDANVVEAAALAMDAVEACTPEGRPLFAGHHSLPCPDAPHLALWHAITLLREFRGDGHVAALTIEGVTGCEALILHAATGEILPKALQASRAWSDDEWATALEALQARGLVDTLGTLTDAGRAHRGWVEERTDQLARAPWEHLGEERAARLRELVRPMSHTIVAAGTFDLSTWDE